MIEYKTKQKVSLAGVKKDPALLPFNQDGEAMLGKKTRAVNSVLHKKSHFAVPTLHYFSLCIDFDKLSGKRGAPRVSYDRVNVRSRR